MRSRWVPCRDEGEQIGGASRRPGPGAGGMPGHTSQTQWRHGVWMARAGLLGYIYMLPRSSSSEERNCFDRPFPTGLTNTSWHSMQLAFCHSVCVLHVTACKTRPPPLTACPHAAAVSQATALPHHHVTHATAPHFMQMASSFRVCDPCGCMQTIQHHPPLRARPRCRVPIGRSTACRFLQRVFTNNCM